MAISGRLSAIAGRVLSSRAGLVGAAMLVMLIGVGLAVYGWNRIQDAERRTATTDAVILKVSDSNCDVEIGLAVDGEVYKGSVNTRQAARGDDDDHPDYTCGRKGESADNYDVGDKLAVVYDPGNPSDIGRPVDRNLDTWLVPGLGAAIAVVGLWGAFIVGRKRPASG